MTNLDRRGRPRKVISPMTVVRSIREKGSPEMAAEALRVSPAWIYARLKEWNLTAADVRKATGLVELLPFLPANVEEWGGSAP